MQEAIYTKLSPDPWNHYGSSGDGLLFASLLAVGQNISFSVTRACKDNQWFRNPEFASGSRELGPRESTISRDMFIGLFCYCFHFRRSELLQDIASYGWKHWWKMGIENRKLDSRVYFTPGLIILLYQLLAHTTGKTSRAKLLSYIPQVYSSDPGYISHLSMLHIYLNLRVRGKILTSEKNVLEKILVHSPKNPLALALLGRVEEARQTLSIWPQDRLPTKQDWKEEWRPQREDKDSNLLPAGIDSSGQHSGGDWLFCNHVIKLREGL